MQKYMVFLAEISIRDDGWVTLPNRSVSADSLTLR